MAQRPSVKLFEEFAFFLYLGPRIGLARVIRWPKNTSYSKHVSTIKTYYDKEITQQ